MRAMTIATARPEPVSVDQYGPRGRSAWLDIDWREHQRWVTVGGRRMNVIELGEGDPIVFIHGLSGSWQNWLENLPHFAREYRVVAMDLPGFGYSEMPAEKITISNYGRAVDELLDQLGIEKAAIVGNSMGGFVGAEIAIQFSTRVEKLVLVSAAGLSVEHLRNDRAMAGLQRLDELLIFVGSQIAGRSGALMSRPRGRRLLMGLVVTHPELLTPAFIAEQVKGTGKPGFVPALDALTSYPIRDRLNEIQSPTLVVWGDSDRLVPTKDAYEFDRLIPDSRLVVYRDTGHCPQMERPDAFNALVDDFLRE